MTENTNPAATDAGLREHIRDALVSVARRHGDWRLRDARSAMADAVMRVLNIEWEGLRIDNDRLLAELATYKEALRDTLAVDSEIRGVIYRKLGLPPASSVADLERALEKLAAAALSDPDGPEVHIRIGAFRAEVRQLQEQLDAALGGEARARQECNELYEEISLLKRQLTNAQQAYSRTFDRMATIENEEQGR